MTTLNLYFCIKIVFEVGQVWKSIKNPVPQGTTFQPPEKSDAKHLQVKGKVKNNSIHPTTTINKFAKIGLVKRKKLTCI